MHTQGIRDAYIKLLLSSVLQKNVISCGYMTSAMILHIYNTKADSSQSHTRLRNFIILIYYLESFIKRVENIYVLAYYLYLTVIHAVWTAQSNYL